MTTLPPANLPPEAMPWARAIEKKVTETVNDTRSVRVNLTATTNSTTAVSNHTVQVAEEVAQVDAKVTNIDGELVVMNSDLTTLNTVTVPALDAELSTIDTRLITAEGDVSTIINTSLPGLDTRLGTAEGDINTLETTTLPALDARLTTAEGDVSTLNTTTIPNLNTSLAEKLPKINASGSTKEFRDVLTFTGAASSHPVNIVIETPITFNNYMTRLNVEGYNYSAVGSDISVVASVYTYSVADANGPGTLINRVASSKGTARVGVRFAKTNEATPRLVVILSPANLPNAAWAYPKITVDALISLGTAPDTWGSGWVGKFVAEADLAASYVSISAPSTAQDLQDTNTLTQGWRTTGATTIDGGKITADSVTAGQIAANAITANELAANAVYANSIQANAVTANAIATDAVTANKIVAGAVTATKISAGAVETDKLAANAVTAAKITSSTITALQIAAETITGDKIAANTIAAEKLLVGDFTNYYNDPEFLNPAGYSVWSRVVTGGVPGIQKAGTGTQNGAYIPSTQIAVTPGDKFRISATRATVSGTITAAASQVSIYARQLNALGTLVSVVKLLDLAAIGVNNSTEAAPYTVPATVTHIELGFYTESTVPATVVVRISDVQIRRLMSSTLIENGAITTDKMTANTINGDRIAAGTLAANKIVANSITTDQLAAGAITADKLDANAITGKTITGGTITGTTITGGSITGTTTLSSGGELVVAYSDTNPSVIRIEDAAGVDYMKLASYGIAFDTPSVLGNATLQSYQDPDAYAVMDVVVQQSSTAPVVPVGGSPEQTWVKFGPKIPVVLPTGITTKKRADISTTLIHSDVLSTKKLVVSDSVSLPASFLSVATYAQLPTTDVKAGETRLVTGTGCVYMWNGTAWKITQIGSVPWFRGSAPTRTDGQTPTTMVFTTNSMGGGMTTQQNGAVAIIPPGGAGLYQMNFTTRLNDPLRNSMLQFHVNGTMIYRVTTGHQEGAAATYTWTLNDNDQVEVRTWVYSGAVNLSDNYFSMHRLGSA